jgi:hypothetical protein
MTAINFPDNPVDDELFSAAGRTWKYNATTGVWETVASDSILPTAHAASHGSAGSDPVTLAQSQVTNLTTDLASKVSTTNFLSFDHQPTGGIDTLSRSARSLVGNTSTNGAIFFTYFTPLVNMTVSEITMRSQTPAGSSLTLARMGLYSVDSNDDMTLVARTANDTTLFTTTNTTYTRSFDTTGDYPATYTLVAGSRYASAHIVTGTTVPGIASVSDIGAISGLSPRTNGARSSQTDLTTTNDATDIVNANSIFWARLT